MNAAFANNKEKRSDVQHNNGNGQATISNSYVIKSEKMSHSSTEPINKVIEGCIKGDRNSQHVLYKMFYGKMLGVCIRYAKDSDEARDILQEGFIKVFTHLKEFGKEGSAEGWIRKIMVNTAIDFYRKNKQSILKADSEYVETNGTEVMDEQEGEEYKNIKPEEVIEAVQKLSPVYKTIFNLYVVEGYTHRQIAEQLGINEGTSKSNYSKAKANLKKLLADKIKVYQH